MMAKLLLISTLAGIASAQLRFSATTCGQTGNAGPSNASCTTSYGGASYFQGATNGIQTFVIPETGIYKIKARGASGGMRYYGNGYTNEANGGAESTGYFSLTQGQLVNVVVGQSGNTGGTSSISGGGGGGGTFIWLPGQNTPLVVAGGGGGYDYTSTYYLPTPGQSSENGDDGARSTLTGQPGGSNGNGGGYSYSTSYAGYSGAGWNSDASCPSGNSYKCGNSRANGNPFVGGVYSTSGTTYKKGGFGGGGAPGRGGGGGGGYSGGGGGVYSVSPRYYGGGGGGGSFVASNALYARKITGANVDWDGSVEFEVYSSDISVFEVSTCGASGPVGPNTTSCNAEYSFLDQWNMFQGVTRGIQEFTINMTGYYKISAKGARGKYGENNPRNKPGSGAHAWGTFYLTSGTTLKVVVGQTGSAASTTYGGGGGGGTFVWDGSFAEEPMLVAGGGGGGSGSTSTIYYGLPGTATPSGSNVYIGGAGGSDGAGGLTGGSGGGGGGWRGDAVSGIRSFGNNIGGYGKSSGFGGGQYSSYSFGGFGGGGCSYYQGGGGGGYSGGAGGGSTASNYRYSGGGGGGSYISGMDAGWTMGGNSDEHGSVSFEFLGSNEIEGLDEDMYIRTCGSTGPTGPSNTGCQQAYRSSAFPSGFYRQTDTNGVQQFQIQETGTYEIIAAGARGGSSIYPNRFGGRGAISAGVFNFTQGTNINIVVGQSGDIKDTPATYLAYLGGAGGGGTFVYRVGGSDPNPLLAAGGGGGSSYYLDNQNHASDSTSGGDASPVGSSGGENGQGGRAVSSSGSFHGYPGAGWSSAPNCASSSCGSSSPTWAGGSTPSTGGASGGFGGGGAAGREGGGGGGYSGGGAGQYSQHGAGGGGGSYLSSSAIVGMLDAGGNGEMEGWVLIKKVEEYSYDYAITNCGADGKTGPTGCDPIPSDTVALTDVTDGIQTHTIVSEGIYLVHGYGAKGGNARTYSYYKGGNGAESWGIFHLPNGTELKAVVGQYGGTCSGTTCSSSGGGGGGGSFLWNASDDSEPLIAAGGGGGGGYASSSYDGYPGVGGVDAQPAQDGLLGARNGSGGTGTSSGGGGGGWRSNGACTESNVCGSGKEGDFVGGNSFSTAYKQGGFGGGAGAYRGGGGGGGYSGGNGGPTYGGAGGSSYKHSTAFASGSNTGTSTATNGKITIRKLDVTPSVMVMTSCGASGNAGPTQSQCRSEYSGATVGPYITRVSSGIQEFKAPQTGTYTFTAGGASGGMAAAGTTGFGRGALVSAKFNLTKNQIVKVVIGQAGTLGIYYGSSGGGGTFVFTEGSEQPLLVAGGGGGSGQQGSPMQNAAGQAQTDGASSSTGDNGGSGGSGGNSAATGGGAGGGWFTNGVCSTYTQMCGGGAPYFNGGEGYSSTTYNIPGGFGGGGGSFQQGGGGGGYSGGAGSSSTTGAVAGGGGSYINVNSTDAEAITGGNTLIYGGFVMIEAPCELGFAPDLSNGGQCVSTDSCEVYPCQANSTCLNLESDFAQIDGRNCTCNTGFVLAGEECVDLDACNDFPCQNPELNTICQDLPPPSLNEAAGRQCGVPAPGYMRNDQNQIVQINACLTSPCGPRAECFDLNPPFGGDVDGRICTCAMSNSYNDGTYCQCEGGYRMSNGDCVDDDACQRFPCGARLPDQVRYVQGTCHDLPPPNLGNESSGRLCSCPDPFVGDGYASGTGCGCPSGLVPSLDDSDCIVQDACVSNPCEEGQVCTVSGSGLGASSRVCSCDPLQGYRGNGRNNMPPCRDINACNTSPCPFNAIACLDMPPPADNTSAGRICTCGRGFELQVVNGVEICVDIDACADVTCPGGQICLDSPDGGQDHVCVDPCVEAPCDNDARSSSDLSAPRCVAILRQQPDQWPPSQSDFEANRECACELGKELTNGGSCQDTDACAKNPCHEHATCMDKPGGSDDIDGRSCICDDGFKGDGDFCVVDLSAQKSSADGDSGSSDTTLIIIAVVIIAVIIAGVAVIVIVVRSRPVLAVDSRAGFENPMYATQMDLPAGAAPASTGSGGYLDVSAGQETSGYQDVKPDDLYDEPDVEDEGDI